MLQSLRDQDCKSVSPSHSLARSLAKALRDPPTEPAGNLQTNTHNTNMHTNKLIPAFPQCLTQPHFIGAHTCGHTFTYTPGLGLPLGLPLPLALTLGLRLLLALADRLTVPGGEGGLLRM